MRIAHVITRLIVGGAQENTISSVLGLNNKKDITVKLYSGPTTGPEGSLETLFSDSPALFHLVPSLVRPIRPLSDYLAYRYLAQEFIKFKPDIVHTHSGKAGFIGRLAAKSAGVKIIIHSIHGPSFGNYQGWLANTLFRNAEKFAAKYTDHFITVADAMKEQYINAGIGQENIYTKIFSGFNLDPFMNTDNSEDIRNQLGINKDNFVVGKIARLFELKGHDSLFKIAPNLVKKIPNIKFLIVGDGPWKSRFKKTANKINCGKNFVFTGLVKPSRIPSIISSMDALVHLSRREGLPRALPQAMAAAKPIVAFDYDGAREVCHNERTGFLVNQNDLDGLEKSIICLFKDNKLRKILGQSGQVFVRDKFTTKKLIEEQYQLYQRLIDNYYARIEST